MKTTGRILPCRDLDGREHRDQRGSGTALMASVVLIVAVVAIAVACVIAWFGCIHKARSAADLASLAAASAYGTGRDACAVARATASNNDATMTACKVDSNGVDFIVRVTVEVQAKPHLKLGPGKFAYTSQAGNA